MIRTIIFDFDGVIVDSVDIKAQAFCHLFRDQPEAIRKRIVDLHVNHSGMSRYEKFRIIYHEFLNRVISDAELERLGAEFSHFCVDKVVNVAYVAGALEFISNHYNEYDLFVASSTPETELRDIVNRRGIGEFFKGVYGTPRTKVDICRMILQQNQLSPQDAVFIGDSLSDYQVARQCGTHFIARIANNSKDLLCQETVSIRLSDLSNLSGVLLEGFNGKEPL
jgi:phosphoglycolate phosphatase-like HAD superfamily hydrolase